MSAAVLPMRASTVRCAVPTRRFTASGTASRTAKSCACRRRSPGSAISARSSAPACASSRHRRTSGVSGAAGLAGDRVGFERATWRFFGKFVSALLPLGGFVIAAFSARRQALHDRMAGCLVVNRE